MIARVVKHALERVAVRSGAGAVGRRRHRRDVLVLAYHNIIPEGDVPAGDRSLHLPERAFLQQLDALRRTHDVVPLTAIFERGQARPRPRAIITFDDAYVGAVTIGVRGLVERHMPATIFAAPGLFNQHTWWDLIADPDAGEINPSLRSKLLAEFQGQARVILDHADQRAHVPQSPAARVTSEELLDSAARAPGITIGSHSWSHANLSAMAPAAVDDELMRSSSWLRDRFSSYVPWLSYPYGLADAGAERAAVAAGYDGAFRVDGGWLTAAQSGNHHSLPRLNIPSGLSLDGFRLRISGIGAR